MINWTKADWTKTNKQIADALSCTPAAVHAHRRTRGIAEVTDPVRAAKISANAPVLISEPIDYTKLAAAFISAHWRLSDGYPSADKLENDIRGRKLDLEKRPGPRQCCNCGGINIEWLEGKIVVLIHPRLARSYNCAARLAAFRGAVPVVESGGEARTLKDVLKAIQ